MADSKPAIRYRPAADIISDVHSLLATYPPVAHDRRYLRITVEDGRVTVSGHVTTRITQRFIEANIPEIPGVQSVDFSALYNDDQLRVEVGRVVPPGVFVNIRYGAVALTGRLPEGTDAAQIVAQISAIPGVVRVVTAFSG